MGLRCLKIEQGKRAELGSGWFLREPGRARLPQSAERVSIEAGADGPSLLSRKFFDEMRAADGTVRHAYAALAGLLDNLSIDSLVTKQNAAEELFRRLGITFAVYAEGGSTERLIPFDLIPRILDRSEWDLVERGCIQRVKAINIFLYDIYHDQEIIKAGAGAVGVRPAGQMKQALTGTKVGHYHGIDLSEPALEL